jgi:NAD(P)-dependent dehydrogenase (short-subunit alcohol dehydrogenase family)
MGGTDARTVVVTGAGRGLGLAAAHRIGRDGYRIVVAELDAERGESAAAELRAAGVEAVFRRLDVGSPESVEELAAALEAAGTRLYGLVNNAGLADAVGGEPFHRIDPAVWDRIVTVNARGPWLVARGLWPLLARAARGGSSTSPPTRRSTARPGSRTTSPPRAR